MKLTRRRLITVAAGSSAALQALAQSPIRTDPAAPRDFARESHDSVQRNGDTLTKFEIPISTEPAFRFKA
jgi:hypothetical protein